MLHYLPTCFHIIQQTDKRSSQKEKIKVRKLCNVFPFVDALSTISDAGIFEKNFRDIYLEELALRRERYMKVVIMVEKSSQISLNIFGMLIRVECLRIARACNNKNSFWTSKNPISEAHDFIRSKKSF